MDKVLSAEIPTTTIGPADSMLSVADFFSRSLPFQPIRPAVPRASSPPHGFEYSSPTLPPALPPSSSSPIPCNSSDNQDLSAAVPFPRSISRLPPSIAKLLDSFMLRYQRLVHMSFFGKPQWQIARARETFNQRLQTSVVSRWSLSICIKIFDAMFDGVLCKPTLAMFNRWFEQFDETWAAYSRCLPSDESQGYLSGTLEIALLALRTTNTISPYDFLINYTPAFLQIAYSDPTLWPTSHNSTPISIVHVLTSKRYELSHFVLLDLLCSMTYGVPQAIEYDTSTPSLKSYVHPTEWVHGCPLELKIMLADINKYVVWSQAGVVPDWRNLEQRLLSWQSSPQDTIPDEESWKMIARLAIQESWRHTLLIYLYMSVCGLASDDTRVSSSVRQVFQILDTVKHHLQPVSKCNTLIQYLIAGACTPNERQRALARARLSDSIETMIWVFPVSQFVPVLDHLWHGVAVDGQPILWSDYLRSRQIMLSVSQRGDNVAFC